MNWPFVHYFILPVTITLLSTFLSMFFIRKHKFLMFLPWISSGILLISYIIYVGLCLLSEKPNFKILTLLYNDYMYFEILWGIACIVTSFAISLCSLLFFGIFKKIKYIGFNKSYSKLYVYVVLLPITIILFIWFQYMLSFSYTIPLVVTVGTYIIIRIKFKKSIPLVTCICIIINFVLVTFFIFKMQKYNIYWCISYYLLCFIFLILYEVKRSKQSEYPYELSGIEQKNQGYFLRFIQLILMLYYSYKIM